MIAYSTRKTPVGRERHAAAALAGQMRELDHGLFKRTYYDPERDPRTVYKIARAGADESGRATALAAETAWAALGRQHRVRGIPHVTLYRIDGRLVLAMPYAPLDSSELDYTVSSQYLAAWRRLGIDDMHDANYRGDVHGRPVCVDLGGYSYNAPFHLLPDDVVEPEDLDEYDYDDDDDDCSDDGSETYIFDTRCRCPWLDRAGHMHARDAGATTRMNVHRAHDDGLTAHGALGHPATERPAEAIATVDGQMALPLVGVLVCEVA